MTNPRKRRTPARETKGDSNAKGPLVYDPTSIFDPDKTKKLLHREERKMAKISQQHVRLIDTTAAIYLRNLISASASEMAPKEDCITLNHLRTAISTDPQLDFLKNPIDAIQDKDGRHAKAYIPENNKKPSGATKANEENAKKLRSVIPECHGDNETVKAAVGAAVSGGSHASTEHIIPDNDDYD
eukprot:scaffold8240_cov133-Cylindrotheca_fusiformis.AAC.12